MKPTKKLLSAIQTYYYHRKLANAGIPWNKEHDLNIISNSKPHNVTFIAITGTFWFTWQTPKGQLRCWQVSEKTYPIGIFSKEIIL